LGTYNGEPLLWRCVDHDELGLLMLSDKIISIKPFDAAGIHTYENGVTQHDLADNSRFKLGSNLWATSNLRAWLNATAGGGAIYWPDNCPPTAGNLDSQGNAYAHEAGFLAESNFSTQERNALLAVSQKNLLNPADIKWQKCGGYEEHHYGETITTVVQNYDDAFFHKVTDRVFLLDVKQLFRVYINLGAGYYTALPTQKAIDSSEHQDSSYLAADQVFSYWLRTPYVSGCPGSSSCDVRCVIAEGNEGSGSAGVILDCCAVANNVGVRPAFYLNLGGIKLTSGNGRVNNPYLLVYL
jgi:hypothetical protein